MLDTLFVAVIFLFFYLLVFVWKPKNKESKLDDLYYVNESPIHGIGCFASRDISSFHDFGVITVHTKEGIERYPKYNSDRYFKTDEGMPWKEHRKLGRYINHSQNPNCETYKSSPYSYGLRSIKPIKQNDELLLDYFDIRNIYMNGNMNDVYTSLD